MHRQYCNIRFCNKALHISHVQLGLSAHINNDTETDNYILVALFTTTKHLNAIILTTIAVPFAAKTAMHYFKIVQP